MKTAMVNYRQSGGRVQRARVNGALRQEYKVSCAFMFIFFPENNHLPPYVTMCPSGEEVVPKRVGECQSGGPWGQRSKKQTRRPKKKKEEKKKKKTVSAFPIGMPAKLHGI